MNKFSWSESKYLIWISVIFIIFIFVVAYSFKYLPSSNTDNENANQSYTTEQTVSEEDDTPEKEVSDNETYTDRNDIRDRETADERQQNRDNIPDLEIIRSSEENPIKSRSAYENAEQLFKEQKYESAIYEYQQLADTSSDISVKAECYYKIAEIYGVMKRYGTALSFAQKSYNTEPSTVRELLLARLYYKTGNTDKSTNHINFILKRDFSDDNN